MCYEFQSANVHFDKMIETVCNYFARELDQPGLECLKSEVHATGRYCFTSLLVNACQLC